MHDSAFANTTSIADERSRIVERLQLKEEREALVESQIFVGIPMQLHSMRRREGWSQKELADRAGDHQGRISLLENIGYESYTVKTLIRIAAAFDVALIVKFAPFSELADQAAHLSERRLLVPRFIEDRSLYPPPPNVFAIDELRRPRVEPKSALSEMHGIGKREPSVTSLIRGGSEHGTAIDQAC